MSKKIEKINNALVITDTVSGTVEVDTPSRLVYYDIDPLIEATPRIVLRNLDDSCGLIPRFNAIKLSEAVDGALAPFTDATWRVFARTNLG